VRVTCIGAETDRLFSMSDTFVSFCKPC